MQILTIIAQAMDIARRKFSREEQTMLIGIFHAYNTPIIPGLLGQHLLAGVEDSFRRYPGIHEEKWGIKKDEMVEKIKALDPISAALLELWAACFWCLDARMLEPYLEGKLTLSTHIEGIIRSLESAAVAEEREVVENAQQILKRMI